MLGDDDMVFHKGVDFAHVLLALETVDFIMARDFPRPMSWMACCQAGIYHGQYFKYIPELWETAKKYQEFTGGGEDSVIAALHYKFSRGKTISINLPYVEHVGQNSFNYLTNRGESSCTWLLNNHPDFTMDAYNSTADALFAGLKSQLLPPQPRKFVR